MNSMGEPMSLVVTLPLPERLFLWASRAWSASHSDLTAVWWSLDRAFAQEGVPPALSPFHQLMSSLYAGLKRWPDIRCVACPRLGRDEACLLSVFAHRQNDNELGARRALQDWVLRSAVRIVCRHAAQCVEIVNAAGLRFTFAQSSAGASHPAPALARSSTHAHDFSFPIH